VPDRYQGESVAVKILQRGETPEEKARLETRFAREVAMMSRVQHKNLVKVLIFCSVNSPYFLCCSLLLCFKWKSSVVLRICLLVIRSSSESHNILGVYFKLIFTFLDFRSAHNSDCFPTLV